MSTLLVSHRLNAAFGADLARAADDDPALEVIVLPQDREARLSAEAIDKIDIAFFSGDVVPDFSRQFFSAVHKAPRLEWLHVFNVGVDHPI